ncbi:MAG: alpha-L-rhamnosidase C-terminal domain-containing protein [Planctomycetota bacterium]
MPLRKREHYGSEPRLLVQLEIEYDNGHIQTVVTDKTWKAIYGPLLESDFLMGEIYDARKEMPGWDTFRFDDSAWHTVAVTDTQHLIEAIRKKDWHLSTGFVGLSYLVPTLTQTGHLDIAYRLLNNDTFPSWGYSIKNGATTIWERWDGWTEEKGFQTPGMNSFNHYAFGSIGRWLFGTVAGIETDGPGYKRIIIRPMPGGELEYARASYKSIHGKIVSDWRIKGSMFTLNVTIPANTTATVYVPAGDIESVTEGGRPAAKAGAVSLLRMENDRGVFAVGSGQYRFVSKLPD